MDILGRDPEERAKTLETLKEVPLHFTPLIHSTSVVSGSLENVKIVERELVDIECCAPIVKIDSNFIHAAAEDYKNPNAQKKSNRGRKPKPKPTKKNRICQGDGSSFNSQVTFTVRGEFTRENPMIKVQGQMQKLYDDTHLKHAIPVPGSTKCEETIRKEYKVKVFTTGVISIPGVLRDDLSDADAVLTDLCEYFSDLFSVNAEVRERHTITRNYKFILRDGQLDIFKFQEYCNHHFTSLLNTRWENIEGFILEPIWTDRDDMFVVTNEPQIPGDFWNVYHKFTRIEYPDDVMGFDSDEELTDEVRRCRAVTRIKKLPERVLSMGEFYTHLQDCDGVRNLYVSFNKLCNTLLEWNLIGIHRTAREIMEDLCAKYFMPLHKHVMDKILRVVLQDLIADVKKIFVNKSKTNMISHISYNPEFYPGFLVKIKTPQPGHPDKKTTIKLFPSGKINVDGANNREEAEYIYWWLNDIFNKNPQFTYTEADEDDDADDDQFSYTDDEEEEEFEDDL